MRTVLSLRIMQEQSVHNVERLKNTSGEVDGYHRAGQVPCHRGTLSQEPLLGFVWAGFPENSPWQDPEAHVGVKGEGFSK